MAVLRGNLIRVDHKFSFKYNWEMSLFLFETFNNFVMTLNLLNKGQCWYV